jgi:hypothetical protein
MVPVCVLVPRTLGYGIRYSGYRLWRVGASMGNVRDAALGHP